MRAYTFFNSRSSFSGKLTECGTDEFMEFATNVQQRRRRKRSKRMCSNLQVRVENNENMTIFQDHASGLVKLVYAKCIPTEMLPFAFLLVHHSSETLVFLRLKQITTHVRLQIQQYSYNLRNQTLRRYIYTIEKQEDEFPN